MPTSRKLKLPDGGTLDLPIPEGFGAPIFAAPEPAIVSNLPLILTGAAVGGLLVWLVLRLSQPKA